MIGGDERFYLKFWAKLTLLEWKRTFSIYFTHSNSAITPSEKVQLTLIGSSLCTLQQSKDEHRTLPLSPPWYSKMQNGSFPCKITLHLKKVCYKVFLCEYCQRQNCKESSLAYPSAQYYRGPTTGKFGQKNDQWLAFNPIRSTAPHSQ